MKLEDLSKEELISYAIDSHSKGNIKEAKTFYKFFLDKNFVDPRMLLNYGVICSQERKYNEAIIIYKKTIELYPHIPYAYSNIGRILKEIEKLDEAEEYLRKAINLKSDYEDAYLNLGIVLNEQCIYDEAAFYTKKAVQIRANFTEAHISLSNIYYNLGDLAKAEEHAREAIRIDDNSAKAHRNLSHILIKKEQFAEGWKEYEWRWKVKDRKYKIGERLQTNKPEWKLGVKGRIFLWAEQGIGDQILFSTLIPDLLKSIDKLVIKIDQRLIPLYKRSYRKDIIYIDENQILNDSEFDYQIALGSLPKTLRPNLLSFKKAELVKLRIDEDKAKRYKKFLRQHKNEKLIGISWKSNSKLNYSKSINLEQLIKATYRSNIKYVNLQYGNVKDEIEQIRDKYNIQILEIEEIDKFNDIDSLAALVSNCDEVISINNVTAHLAGSLNMRTRILLSTNSTWDYGINESKNLWYNSMKLYRQKNPGDWQEVLKQLSNDMKE